MGWAICTSMCLPAIFGSEPQGVDAIQVNWCFMCKGRFKKTYANFLSRLGKPVQPPNPPESCIYIEQVRCQSKSRKRFPDQGQSVIITWSPRGIQPAPSLLTALDPVNKFYLLSTYPKAARQRQNCDFRVCQSGQKKGQNGLDLGSPAKIIGVWHFFWYFYGFDFWYPVWPWVGQPCWCPMGEWPTGFFWPAKILGLRSPGGLQAMPW